MIYEFGNVAINVNDTITSVWYEESCNTLYVARNALNTTSFLDVTKKEFNEAAKKIVKENSNMIFISENDLLNVNNMLSYETFKKGDKILVTLTVIVEEKYQKWAYTYEDELQYVVLVTNMKEACNWEFK